MNDKFEELEKRCREIQRKINEIDADLSDLKGLVVFVVLAILLQPLFFK